MARATARKSPGASTGKPAEALPAEGYAGIDRALIALKRLGHSPDPVGLNELARDLGMPKSSLYRAFSAFRRAGLVAQDAHGRYHLGSEFLRLAFEYHERVDQVALVEPLLRTLAERFGQTAQYAKLVGPEVVYLGKIEPAGVQIRMTSSVGGRNPAHCASVGKAQLAHVLTSETAVRAYVKEHGPLVKRTDHTIASAEHLHEELERTRERGFALDDQELDVAVVCIGFPLFLASPNVPSSAVSVASILQRMSLDELVESAEEIRTLINDHFGSEDVTRPLAPID